MKAGQEPHDPGQRASERDTDRAARQRLLCAQCRLEITSDEARIEVAGQHEHTCANPHGFAFHIGCFASAPGCAGVGRAETYWSWFPGYSWRLALCRGCHAHLGWLFAAGGARFHGLILDRLVPDRASD